MVGWLATWLSWLKPEGYGGWAARATPQEHLFFHSTFHFPPSRGSESCQAEPCLLARGWLHEQQASAVQHCSRAKGGPNGDEREPGRLDADIRATRALTLAAPAMQQTPSTRSSRLNAARESG